MAPVRAWYGSNLILDKKLLGIINKSLFSDGRSVRELMSDPSALSLSTEDGFIYVIGEPPSTTMEIFDAPRNLVVLAEGIGANGPFNSRYTFDTNTECLTHLGKARPGTISPLYILPAWTPEESTHASTSEVLGNAAPTLTSPARADLSSLRKTFAPYYKRNW